MERQRANSKYGDDLRVNWQATGGVTCQVEPQDVPDDPPPFHPSLNWDGTIYSDERLEFQQLGYEPEGGWHIFLAAHDRAVKVSPRPDGFASLDEALAAVLGEPR